MARRILVGCCGFCVARQRYYNMYKVVEIQQTFYKLPSSDTLLRWREEAPEDFIFTMKAWQAVTHPPTSPTWKKSGIKINGSLKDKYGLLRPTPENFEAWRRIVQAALLLKARVIVLQTPPSFGFSTDNYRQVAEFFSKIERPDGIVIAWEPRGTWHDKPDVLREIAMKFGIIIAVDPLRRNPPAIGDIVYFRLHGIGGREVNYRYKYSEEDLRKLTIIIKDIVETSSVTEIYVMFNNIYMYDDSRRFKDIVQRELRDLVEVL